MSFEATLISPANDSCSEEPVNNHEDIINLPYEKFISNAFDPPAYWKDACVHSEYSLHQLSPYIGKVKSTIARDLVRKFSQPGDTVVDPFSGSGTIPTEALLEGRKVFASDISPYSRILTKAKLNPPRTLQAALSKAKRALNTSRKLSSPDLRSVPNWVRAFFHPKTLKEIINLAAICRRPGNEFLFACFLGILHHQRPGFLSYPSSHLVPYLRDKKFPKEKFPELYKYRDIETRLLSKINRVYKRFPPVNCFHDNWSFRQSSIQNLSFPKQFDSLITSPPYMNALDYGRDNRLRLWLIDPYRSKSVDNPVTNSFKAFDNAMASLAKKIENGLSPGGYCVFIIGERIARSGKAHPSKTIWEVLRKNAPSLNPISVITDDIPDVRRSRRNCKGIKTEHIMVFRRS